MSVPLRTIDPWILPDGRDVYIDFAYPEARLAIEVDSHRHHSSRKDWAGDRARNGELVALGWRILHITYEELVADPAAVADRIRRALLAG
ncbi:MAG TPA: DUF559 domain-containing protein [Actinomycetota bacterium]|nr:DUF559 domain-containing protein [Actinomycetota bacterium]